MEGPSRKLRASRGKRGAKRKSELASQETPPETSPFSQDTPLDARFLKARCDFLAIASRYTRLRRTGRQYVGLCPFHSERHPSFYVEPKRKIWKCFGCERGGDLFSFLMLAENCDFLGALRIVAGFSGVASESVP